MDVTHGDGYNGWPEHAPFDAIIVTAAPDHVPQPLSISSRGGRLVVPVGGRGVQQLTVITKGAERLTSATSSPCASSRSFGRDPAPAATTVEPRRQFRLSLHLWEPDFSSGGRPH